MEQGTSEIATSQVSAAKICLSEVGFETVGTWARNGIYRHRVDFHIAEVYCLKFSYIQ